MSYTHLKLIDTFGKELLIFIGVGEHLESEARLIKLMENLLGNSITNLIMKEVSSLITYGTSVNTGHNIGLWKIFQDYRLEKFSEPIAPLLTIWCCAHKSSLTWKAAINEIPEIKNMRMPFSGMSSYFAKSGVRCRELKNIAEYNFYLLFADFQKYLKYDGVNSLIN